jgi:hypothetical protein
MYILSSHRENAVLKWIFKLNNGPIVVETWNLKGSKLQVTHHCPAC